jgi:hypothetical protein
MSGIVVPTRPIPGYIGEWQGGKPAGFISNGKFRIAVTLRLDGRSHRQSIRKADYHTEDEAVAAAQRLQVATSIAHNKTKNRYRLCFDEARGEYHLEVQLTHNKTMLTCLCDHHVQHLMSRVWGANPRGYAVCARKASEKWEWYHKLIAAASLTDAQPLTDHINGNRLDNRCFNLRAASVVENARNHSLSVANRSGHCGVSLRIQGKFKAYIASWQDGEGKRVKKSFSVSKYGDAEAKRRALDVRKSIEQKFGITVHPRAAHSVVLPPNPTKLLIRETTTTTTTVRELEIVDPGTTASEGAGGQKRAREETDAEGGDTSQPEKKQRRLQDFWRSPNKPSAISSAD